MWPSSTFGGCTGKESTSGLQARDFGINGRKDVLLIHLHKISEVWLVATSYVFVSISPVLLQHQDQIAITDLGVAPYSWMGRKIRAL